MLYDRIIDNKEVGRKIWKVRTAFNNDLYSVERFVLRWMTCTTLNDLHYVEWFVLGWMICIRWMICTTLNDLHYVEWFARRWMICTMLNDLYYVEWFALRWMICTTLNDLYYVEWFVLRWMIYIQARRTGYGRYGGPRTRIFSNLVGSSVKMEKKIFFFKLIFC